MPIRPREHLQTLTPYEWEASASEIAAAAGIAESAVIRFDTNTTAWPPLAWEEISLDTPRLAANEYPHPSNEPLRSRLAELVGVEPEQVVVTCGADEALSLVANVFLGPGRRAIVADPSFSMFRVVSETVGATMLPIEVGPDWDLPAAAVQDALQAPDVTVAWLCSPNNPTGRLLDGDVVAAAAAAAPDTLIVVDEAYYEIAGQTVAHLLASHPNLLLIRTFSKGYGLAGARIGYAVGQRDVVQALEAVRLPQNMTVFGIMAAFRALADQAGLEARVRAIVAERERLAAALAARGWELVPSSANFVLARPPTAASELSHWLQGAGLIVRSYAHHPRLRDWLRIAVRAPAEDDRLLARLDELDSSA
jgi:histidinol-phosphate aminotransferase